MNDAWEAEIAALLTDLAEVQSLLLQLLAEKRQVLAGNNHELLRAITDREERLIQRLQACHDRRQQLLARAQHEGMMATSLSDLSGQLPTESRGRVQEGIRQAAHRSRLLQHQSLTNWVLVQRTLLHLSQLIEIIATGGHLKPTYGNGSERSASGALVDRAA